jgi:signal transduction histidine kinase
MSSIRNQLRVRFAVTISFLLVACSAAIWLWARYLADREVRALLSQDVSRLGAAITWNPDLSAFELRLASAAHGRQLISEYWQICDPAGALVWKSDSWAGIGADRIGAAPGSSVFTLRAASGEAMFALFESVATDGASARRSMIQDFPEEVIRAVGDLGGQSEIVATELEFADDRLIYEITLRRGNELLTVEMDGAGQIEERSVNRVPTALPEPVLRTLSRVAPGCVVRSFDWRATQGRLEFIVNAALPDGRPSRQCISSTGDLIPLYFPQDPASGRPVVFNVLAAGPHNWRSEMLRQLGLLLAAVCGAGVLATIAISEWLTHRTLVPIARIARDTGRIDDRRLSERLQVAHPDDEIGHLALAINGMLDRIETAFERQRRFARDASHELRGPLTGLIAHLELALGQARDAAAAGHLDLALERAQRLRELIDKLLLLARQDSDKPVSLRDDVSLRECLEHVAADFPAAYQRRIRLLPAGSGHDEMFVRANEELLHSMFRNIIENALKFSPPDSPVQVRLWPVDGWQAVEVLDTGPGIPEEFRGRVFEPFVRLGGSASVEGSGLGLSIVHWIVQIHGARIEIDPAPGGPGTRFTVQIPSAPAGPG